MSNFQQFLRDNNACPDARHWVSYKTLEEAWETCERGDWLLWLAKKCDVGIRIITAAKAKCATLALHLMKDQRSIDAVDAAIRFGRGEISEKELRAYAVAAAYSADRGSVGRIAADSYYAATAAIAVADAIAISGSDREMKTLQECARIVREIIPFDAIKQKIEQ